MYIRVTELTGEQQAAVDLALNAITVQFPGLSFGEFESSGGGYQIVVTKHQQGIERGEPLACTQQEVSSKREVIQSLDSPDGKYHLDILDSSPD